LDPSTLALQVVGGFTVGALLGYVMRGAAKWFLIFLGVALLPVFGLWYLGLVNVNWEGVNEVVGRIVNWMGVNVSNMTQALVSTGAFGISGLVGLLFGVSGGFKHTIFPEGRRKFVRRKSNE